MSKRHAKAKALGTLTKYRVTLFIGNHQVVQEVSVRGADVEAIRQAKADFLAEVTRDTRMASAIVQDLTPPANGPKPSSLASMTGQFETKGLISHDVLVPRENPFAEAAAQVREAFDHPVDHTSGLRDALADKPLLNSEGGQYSRKQAAQIEARQAEDHLGVEPTPEQEIVLERFDALEEARQAEEDAEAEAIKIAIADARNETGPAYGPGNKVWLISAPKAKTVHVSQSEGDHNDAYGELAWCGMQPEFRHNFDLDDYANVNCPLCKAAVAANQTRSNRS